MKTILLLFTLLSSVVLRAQDPIPDYFAANPKWEQRIGSDTYVQLFIDGDTMVSGIHYHKLMATGDELTGFDERKGIRLQGLIRQEGRKVFYRGFVLLYSAHNNTFNAINDQTPLPRKEFLLFDFGLDVGDTLFVQNNPLFEPYLERYPEDTGFVVFQVRPDERKIYPNSFISEIRLASFNGQEYLRYYEGFSESHNFLSEMFPYLPSQVTCYKNDSTQMVEGKHRLPISSVCNFITSVEDSPEPDATSVYPLPSQGLINFSEPVNTYTLYNARGQEVMTSTNSNQQVNLRHLPNGLYFLHYSYGRQQSAVQKVVLSK